MKIEIIKLGARQESNLNWSNERTAAIEAITRGKKILWSFDFGLFNDLKMPLSHPGQFLNFTLALDHFKEKIWPEFKRFSKGALLYKAKPFFDLQVEQEVEGFEKIILQRDIAADYLSALAARIVDSIPTFIQFDGLNALEPTYQLALSHPDLYGGIELIDGFDFRLKEECEVAICLPAPETITERLYQLLYETSKGLQQEHKFISEARLHQLWEGISKIYYDPQTLTKEGKRKLNGFEAAGGETIMIKDTI